MEAYTTAADAMERHAINAASFFVSAALLRATPVPPIGGDAAVEAEQERREAVHEPNRDDAERPGRRDREPHQGDELEGVPHWLTVLAGSTITTP